MAQHGPKTQLLIATLRDLLSDLDAAEESHWRTWIQRDLDRILKGDYSGVEHFLSAFGGMGSLSDLCLGPADRDKRFGINLSKAYSLAREIHREVESAI